MKAGSYESIRRSRRNERYVQIKKKKLKGLFLPFSFLKKGLGIVAIALIAAIMVMPGMAQTPPEEPWNRTFGGAGEVDTSSQDTHILTALVMLTYG
jgi:hypothetical protein